MVLIAFCFIFCFVFFNKSNYGSILKKLVLLTESIDKINEEFIIWILCIKDVE